MELRHLRYFTAVVAEGQFVRAAAELHVAQSAVSEQVRDLERELGTELLHRDRRGVTPTAAGELLLAHATAILERAEDARAEIAELSGVVSGTLRVGSGSPSGPIPLATTLAELQRRHPRVDVEIVDAPSEQLVALVESGDLDVTFASLAPEQISDRVHAVLITREPMIALLPADHRLAGQRRVSLRDLAGEPLVAFARGSGMRAVIADAYRSAGLAQPRIIAETIDPLGTLELVGAGLGSSLAPRSFAEHAGPEVAVVELARPGMHRPISIAWDPSRRSLPALRAFLEIAAAWLPAGALG